MLIDCARCGAPLDVKPDSWVITCAYCRSAQRVRTPPTPVQTPPQWQPPRIWMPPTHLAVQSIQLTYDPEAARSKLLVVGAAVLVIPLLVLGAMGAVGWVLFQDMREKVGEEQRLEGEKTQWDGEETWTCDGLIEDREIDVSARLAIASNQQGGCTLRRVKIRGARLVVDMTGGHLTIEDSDIEAQGKLGFSTQGTAALTIKNTTLRITGSADEDIIAFASDNVSKIKVTGSKLALSAGGPGHTVTLAQARHGSNISIVDTAITISHDPKPEAVRVLVLRNAARARMTGGSIAAGKLPLLLEGRTAKASHLDKVDLRGSTVTVKKK